MSKTRKLLAALMSIAMLLSMLTGCSSANPTAAPMSAAATDAAATDAATAAPSGPDALVAGFQELHITVLGHLPTGSRAAVEDVLTPIWREKTKVIPEVIQMPADQDWNTWLQMQVAAGTLPDVITVTNGIFEVVERYKILKDGGALKEVKKEDMQKYMPRTEERIAKLGVTIDEWYNANVDAGDGKLWFMPCIPKPALSKEYRSMRFMQDQINYYPYFLWFRDDILKTIYPEAKSEAELKQLWYDQGGKLTTEDIMDAPLNSPEAITDYLRKVKALNLKIDNNPVIPGHLTLNNSSGALWWSLLSFSGFHFTDSVETTFDVKRGLFNEMTLTPEWKDWIQFNNQNFNEGNFGQEMFIQKDEQKNAKMINGEYAVMNWWGPIADARNKAKETGRTYGWRLYPVFGDMPLVTKYQDVTDCVFPVSNNWGAKSFNPKTVTDEMMPQLLNWMDWNYSEEASSLRAWGPPEFYTGDGNERRFKPEYKAVEDYVLSGKQDQEGKDGIYYGINSSSLNDRQVWNHEVYGLAEAIEYDYCYSPMYVYPESVEAADTFIISLRAWREYYIKNFVKFAKEPALPAEVKAAKAEYDKIRQQRTDLAKANADARGTTLIKCITDTPENFEANYQAYMDLFTEAERELLKKEGEAWLNYYRLRMATWTYVD